MVKTKPTPQQLALLLETLAAHACTLSELLCEMQDDASDGVAGEKLETRLRVAAQLADGMGMLADSGISFTCRGSLQTWAVGRAWADAAQAV